MFELSGCLRWNKFDFFICFQAAFEITRPSATWQSNILRHTVQQRLAMAAALLIACKVSTFRCRCNTLSSTILYPRCMSLPVYESLGAVPGLAWRCLSSGYLRPHGVQWLHLWTAVVAVSAMDSCAQFPQKPQQTRVVPWYRGIWSQIYLMQICFVQGG
jgi:hypothetical protein